MIAVIIYNLISINSACSKRTIRERQRGPAVSLRRRILLTFYHLRFARRKKFIRICKQVAVLIDHEQTSHIALFNLHVNKLNNGVIILATRIFERQKVTFTETVLRGTRSRVLQIPTIFRVSKHSKRLLFHESTILLQLSQFITSMYLDRSSRFLRYERATISTGRESFSIVRQQ